jgi:hypothetical protein
MKVFKFLLVFLMVLSSPVLMKGADRDSKTVDVIFGTSSTYGLTCRNHFAGTFGMYFNSHYFNTAFQDGYSGDTHFNSQFGWTMFYDTLVTVIKPYGMTFGINYNFSKLFKRPNCGLSASVGIGYAVKQVQYEYYSTRVYNNQYLSTSTEVYFRTEKKTVPSLEMLLMYDLVPRGIVSIVLVGGYNTGTGVIAAVGVSCRID